MMAQRKTRSSSNSRDAGEENSETIPLDLAIEILMKLPVKSIARFRCVEKMWDLTLRSPNFTDSFFAISSSHPKILFTFQKEGQTFFFTSPQPQNSSTLTASFHMCFKSERISSPVRGLVCGLGQHYLEGKRVSVPFIYNPSTGQSLTLPRVETSRHNVISYFGYDPVNKQFKVLCMTSQSIPYGYSIEHQVLTLGSEWRMIKCDIPHYPCDNHGLCINGVLYYFVWLSNGHNGLYEIVSFDIRSEKFKHITRAWGMRKTLALGMGKMLISCTRMKSTLVSYKGKLAMLQPNIVNRTCTGILLWVLEDDEWTEYIYGFSTPLWETIVEKSELGFVGTTDTGEIVLSTDLRSNFLYYNPERNTIKRVEILGMEAFKDHRVYTFLNHVEDVKLFMASV